MDYLKRSQPTTENGGTPSTTKRSLAPLAAAMLLSSLGTSIANVALPTIATALDAPFAKVQWIVLAYLIASTALMIAVGRLADIVGRVRLLRAGIIAYTTASIVCGLAPSIGVLITARAVQGLGAAVMMVIALALVGETAAKERTGTAMGLLGMMSAFGTALGPSLGGALVAAGGWRLIFLVNLPLGIAALYLVPRHLPVDRRSVVAARQPFDTRGTLLLATSLAALALALTADGGTFGMLNATFFVAAVTAASLFARSLSSSASPIINPALFRSQTLRAGLVMNVLVMAVMMATLIVGPFYLAGGLGLDAGYMGLALSAGPIAAALAGLPAGRLVDRFGAEPAIVGALGAIAAGALLLATMPDDLGLFGYVARIVLITAGHALLQAANNTAVILSVAVDSRGVVSGLLNVSRQLGLITGASLIASVFALATGAHGAVAIPPHKIAAGVRTAFTLAAALILVAFFLAARRMFTARGVTSAHSSTFRAR